METLLVSACLLGVSCKYSGGDNCLPESALKPLRERYRLIPVCPETAGGLPTPRAPSERLGTRVVSDQGLDVTEAFKNGAKTATDLANKYSCKMALMKENSPSCGSGTIYDGSFSGRLVPGDGVTAEALKALGLNVFGESQTASLL